MKEVKIFITDFLYASCYGISLFLTLAISVSCIIRILCSVGRLITERKKEYVFSSVWFVIFAYVSVNIFHGTFWQMQNELIVSNFYRYIKMAILFSFIITPPFLILYWKRNCFDERTFKTVSMLLRSLAWQIAIILFGTWMIDFCGTLVYKTGTTLFQKWPFFATLAIYWIWDFVRKNNVEILCEAPILNIYPEEQKEENERGKHEKL